MLRASPTVVTLLLARSQAAVAGESIVAASSVSIQSLVPGSAAQHVGTSSEPISTFWPCYPPNAQLSAATRAFATSRKKQIITPPKFQIHHDPYNTVPTNYVQLLQHIYKTNKLTRLQDLVNKYGDKFDAVHASAALVRLPKVAFRDKTQTADNLTDARKAKIIAVFEKIKDLMVAKRDRMFARQLANALWACGKMVQLQGGVAKVARQTAHEMLAELKSARRGLLRTAAPVELAQVLVGMAHLNHQDTALMERVLLRVENLLAQTSGAELAQMMWAVTELQHKDEALMMKMADRAVELKWHFRAREVAMVGWALSKQGLSHPKLMATLCEVATEHIQLFKPNTISMMAYALHKQQHRDKALLRELCDQAVLQLEGFTDHGLALLLHSLRHLGYKHKELLQAVAKGIAAEEAVQVTAQAAGNLLEVFSHFRQTGADVDYMAINLAQSVARKIHKLQPTVVVNFLEALHKSGRNDEQLLNIVCDFVAQQVEHYAEQMQYKGLKPRDVSEEAVNPYDWDLKQQRDLVQILNSLGFQHEQLLDTIATHMMPTSWAAQPAVLAYLLYELSKAGVRNPTLAAQIGESRINPHLSSLNLRVLSAALAGCAAMGSDNGPLARAVRDKVKENAQELTSFGVAVLPGAMLFEPKWFDQQSFEALFDRAAEVVEQLDEAAVSGLVTAMGKTGYKRAGLVEGIRGRATRKGWQGVLEQVAQL